MKKVSSDIADWIFEAFWSKGWIRSSTAKKYRIPELRDIYSFSKLRQEQLFWEFQKKDGFELVVLRPGVIYGPGGGAFSNRVGLQVGPVYFHLGGSNLLPLSYVANCAEVIDFAAGHADSTGQAYNLHDDDLPTALRYVSQYKKKVKPIRSVRLPCFATRMLAAPMERYNRRSQGQFPAILTRYKVASVGADSGTLWRCRSTTCACILRNPDRYFLSGGLVSDSCSLYSNDR